MANKIISSSNQGLGYIGTFLSSAVNNIAFQSIQAIFADPNNPNNWTATEIQSAIDLISSTTTFLNGTSNADFIVDAKNFLVGTFYNALIIRLQQLKGEIITIYDPLLKYTLNARVRGATDSKIYKSLINDNQGNTPESSPANWEKLENVPFNIEFNGEAFNSIFNTAPAGLQSIGNTRYYGNNSNNNKTAYAGYYVLIQDFIAGAESSQYVIYVANNGILRNYLLCDGALDRTIIRNPYDTIGNPFETTQTVFLADDIGYRINYSGSTIKFMEIWGRYPSTGYLDIVGSLGSYNVVFPIAFLNQCANVIVGLEVAPPGNSGGAVIPPLVISKTTTGFTVRIDEFAAVTQQIRFVYQAIGN